MLGLITPSKREWVDVAENHFDALLADHAHCELKAAHSALSLVARYGFEAPCLVEPLIALVHEETQHFSEVEAKLKERSATLTPPQSDAYVVALKQAAKRTRGDRPPLLDRLVVAAMVEGRSCERFRLLSEHLKSSEMRSFYRELMRSEATHFTLFSGLARTLFGDAEGRTRLDELAREEATIVENLPLLPLVHG